MVKLIKVVKVVTELVTEVVKFWVTTEKQVTKVKMAKIHQLRMES